MSNSLNGLLELNYFLTFLDEYMDRGWLRIGGAARVVALVALEGRGEGEPAGGAGPALLPRPRLNLNPPPSVVVHHPLRNKSFKQRKNELTKIF